MNEPSELPVEREREMVMSWALVAVPWTVYGTVGQGMKLFVCLLGRDDNARRVILHPRFQEMHCDFTGVSQSYNLDWVSRVENLNPKKTVRVENLEQNVEYDFE